MTLSAFLEKKIPESRKIVFIFSPSPNVAPNPTDQSPSNSISRVPLQISLALFFDLPSKLMVVHKINKCNIFIFSQMALTILIKFCGFIVHSKPNDMTLSDFPGNIPETRKIFF